MLKTVCVKVPEELLAILKSLVERKVFRNVSDAIRYGIAQTVLLHERLPPILDCEQPNGQVVTVRLGPLKGLVEAYAKKLGFSRPEFIRFCVKNTLRELGGLDDV